MKFKDIVYNVVKNIPKGNVVSYGQVAAAAGSPRAARQVGFALMDLDITDRVPWHRVINNKGYISIRGNDYANKDLQKHLLQKEGIEVDDNFYVNIDQYRYYFKA